jgi:hypothetical protein
MSTVLDNAKKTAYTAFGMQVLVIDEITERMNERLAEPRHWFEGEVAEARKLAEAARKDWTKQAESFADRFSPLTDRVESFGETLQERVQPVTKAGLKIMEPGLKQLEALGHRAPAPVAKFIDESVARTREFMTAPVTAAKEAAEDVVAPVAPVARKAPARKPVARTSAKVTPKVTAKAKATAKAPARKAPARKPAA